MALVTYHDALWPYNLNLEHSEQFEGPGVRKCACVSRRLILSDFKLLLLKQLYSTRLIYEQCAFAAVCLPTVKP